MIEILNKEMKKIDTWLECNGLVINTDKTHYMVFHRAKFKSTNKDISFRDIKIKRVTSVKFLGLIIDDQLTWLEHIQYIKNKVSKSIGILCKVRNCLDKTTLHNLYFTFVYPYLIYGIEIWGNVCNSYLEPLIKLQKKCIRTITFSHHLEHTDPLFKELNILKFTKLVIHRIAMLMFKYSPGLVPMPIKTLFAKNNQFHNYNTRQSGSLHSSLGRGEASYRTFSFHGINIWNYLLKYIPINVSYACFKKTTKCYLMENDFL